MFNISRHLSLLLVAMTGISACSPSSDSAPDKATGAPSTVAEVMAPTAESLLALEKQATEAYIEADGTFFEKILSDKFVMQTGGSRHGKTDVVDMIAAVQCEVKDGWTLTEPQLSKIDDDTYVLTYKSSREGSCTRNGTTEKLPGSVRASSIWARSDDAWQVVFHGEIPIPDQGAAAAPDQEEPSATDNKVAADAAASRVRSKPVSDPISDALMAAERPIWDAWMKHDAEKIRQLTAEEIAFVNLFGTYLPDKESAIADWTSTACEVSSFMLGNGVGSLVSPTIGILTFTGTVRGTCGGQDISGTKIFGTTVYRKDGDAWKWVFGFNSPN
ncbi:DUF4440 domain-containing protein [Dokdonella sp.]|uniref:DUF4440 domain-containing protein n=1 Tax=Dokdonella sp. TaxID=2291710 RepID=UPI003527D291